MSSVTEKNTQLNKEQLFQKLKQLLGEVEEHEIVLLLRKRLKLNQFEVCSRTGIIPQQLSAYESGKKDLSEENINNIVHVLETSLEQQA